MIDGEYKFFRVLFQITQNIQESILKYLPEEYEGSCLVQTISTILALVFLFVAIPSALALFIWVLVEIDRMLR